MHRDKYDIEEKIDLFISMGQARTNSALGYLTALDAGLSQRF